MKTPTAFPRVIAVACQKGGSCKTTTSFNLAACLVRRGHRVLLLDMDPQGDLTLACGHNPDTVAVSMFEVMNDAMPLREVIRAGSIGADIAPASLALQTLDMEMSWNNHRALLLRDALYPVRDRYDFVVIDTPPAMSLLTYNALQAAGEVVVPMLCEPFSLRGMGRLLRIIGEMQRESKNPALLLAAVVACRYDARKRLTQQAFDMLQALVPHGTPVAVVRDNVSVAEASGLQRDVISYAPQSNGAQDYQALTDMLMEHDNLRRHRIAETYRFPVSHLLHPEMTEYLAG